MGYLWILYYVPKYQIWGPEALFWRGQNFFSWPTAGLTNRVPVQDSQAGAPLNPDLLKPQNQTTYKADAWWNPTHVRMNCSYALYLKLRQGFSSSKPGLAGGVVMGGGRTAHLCFIIMAFMHMHGKASTINLTEWWRACLPPSIWKTQEVSSTPRTKRKRNIHHVIFLRIPITQPPNTQTLITHHWQLTWSICRLEYGYLQQPAHLLLDSQSRCSSVKTWTWDMFFHAASWSLPDGLNLPHVSFLRVVKWIQRDLSADW